MAGESAVLGDPRPWPQMRGATLAFLPLGSWEQHGESLPLYTDTLIAVRLSWEAAGRLGGVVLPPLAYGVSWEHIDFPLTASLSPETLCSLLRDIWGSLEAHGVRLVVAVNGHGGNKAALEACSSEWNYRRGSKLRVLPVTVWDLAEGLVEEQDIHAGRAEASILAYLEDGSYEGQGIACKPLYPLRRTAECSPTGSVYPGRWKSDRTLGENLFRHMAEKLVAAVKDALKALGKP